MEIEYELATSAHPASSNQWVLTSSAVNQLVDDLPGKLVKVKYQGEPVGVVTHAQREGEGVRVTVRLHDDVGESARLATIGPALHCPTIPANDPRIQPDARGVLRMGMEWRVLELGLLPQDKIDEAVAGALRSSDDAEEV